MKEQFKPLHLACESDEAAPNMALISIIKGIATATNGKLLVKINLAETSALSPEELDTLDGKFIHMEVWKEIHKCDSVEFDDDQIICHKNDIKKIFEYADPDGEFFPNTIVEDVKKAGEGGRRILSLDPDQVTIAGKIFGGNQIYFSSTKGISQVLLFPGPDSGMFAVLQIGEGDGVNRYMFL